MDDSLCIGVVGKWIGIEMAMVGMLGEVMLKEIG
jgi:hypothetical protein